MFLKRIEIYGFKSFAQKSVLDFEYNKAGNITAVVGPNGSGKSNVADAIRWVTGEQSSKNLRSKKSEDIIFCGSVAKPRGSYAEVSILLADEKPFKFELNNKEYTLNEIEVSRKLYRSGESEYLINHKKVRLADIGQLLASLGFGQSSYTVIGQGMVDRLLFFTASERKVLFDEAAGVKQYEIKREQSLRKLESTDNNLIRLRDILAELSPRVTNLRRLVKRAEGRKEYEQELKEAQQKYFGSLFTEYSEIIRESEQKRTELNKQIIQIDEKIARLQDKIDNKQDNPHSTERRSLEEKIASCTDERDKLMRDVSYLGGQTEGVVRNQDLFASKKAEYDVEKENLTSKINFLMERIGTEQATLDETAATKDRLNKPVQSLLTDISGVESELREPTGNQSVRIDELRAELNKLISDKLSVNEAKAKLVELEKDAKTLTSEIAETKASEAKVQKEYDKLQSDLENLEKEIKKLSSLINPATLERLENSISEIENIPPTQEDYTDKLNKLFEQFRDIARAVNGNEREKITNEINQLKRNIQVASEKLVSLRIILGTKESRYEQINADIVQNKAKITSAEISDQDIQKLREELIEYEGSASERQNVLLRKKDNLQDKLTKAKELLHAAELEYNRIFSLVSNQKSELDSATRRLTEVDGKLVKLTEQFVQSNESELNAKLQRAEKELNKKEEDLAKLRGGLTQVITAEREYEQANLIFERENRALQDEKNNILSLISVLEIEVAKTQVRLEDLNEEMRLSRVTITNNAKHGYLDQMEKDVLKLKMENLRRKLEAIGGVDPETEAEFIELEQRETEMSTQLNDLTKAKADLEKVVIELDERIKKQFSQVFSNISKEFTRYFAMLFGGGNADLKLGEDEEGSFGIEISANPPGKRVQSLNALSGGERTLTSLALLFAILSVNPSPFCVLDEVDAALDESNTLRFVKILTDLAHKTQFIIISHNRDTMKIANNLYGVTMNDEHISKLLSIHLTEALTVNK